MKIYENADLLTVEGRGNIAVIEIPRDEDLPVDGELIQINGSPVVCRGLEIMMGMVRKQTVGIRYWGKIA